MLHGHGDGNHVFLRSQVDVETISQGFKDPLDDQDGGVFVWVDEDAGEFPAEIHVEFLPRTVRNPICSMYGIVPNICLKNQPNVGKYSIHEAYVNF